LSWFTKWCAVSEGGKRESESKGEREREEKVKVHERKREIGKTKGKRGRA